MATLNEILQQYVNADYETLVAVAQKALVNLMPVCKQIDPDNEGVLMASSIILAAIGADGVLTAKERQFITDVIGLGNEAIDNLLKLYNSEVTTLVDKFADTMSSDIKAETLALVTAFAACDETISREETAFIRKIME